jgi:hypothetical protein
MMTSQDVAGLQDRIRAAVQLHWKAFLIEGILLVILGLGAIIVPALASVAITIFLGLLFLINGVVGLALTFWARQMPGFWWSLLAPRGAKWHPTAVARLLNRFSPEGKHGRSSGVSCRSALATPVRFGSSSGRTYCPTRSTHPISKFASKAHGLPPSLQLLCASSENNWRRTEINSTQRADGPFSGPTL